MIEGGVDIKICPDALLTDSALASTAALATVVSEDLGVYMYSLDIKCKYSQTECCASCGPHLKGLKNAGIALLRPLSEEQLDYPIDLCMRRTDPITVKFVEMGNGVLKAQTLHHIQQYHRACLCHEGDDIIGDNGNTSPLDWVPISLSSRRNDEKPVSPISPQNWTESSNGAWYLLFSQPEPSSDDVDEVLPELFTTVATEGSGYAQLSSWWCAHFASEAEKATHLINNLRMQLCLNQIYIDAAQNCQRDRDVKAAPESPFEPYHAADLTGLLVARGPGVIYHITPPGDDIIRVTSVMTLVQAKHITNLIANKTVPRRVKLFPGSQECTLENYEDICRRIALSKDRPSTCGDDEVVTGCDNRPILFVNGMWYAAWTYGEHYVAKGNLSQEAMEKIKTEIECMPTSNVNKPIGHYLVKALAAPRQLRLTELLSFPDRVISAAENKIHVSSEENPETAHIRGAEHTHASPIHLLPELCRPLGLARHFFSGLSIGACVWKLQSMLVAHEARSFMMHKIADSISVDVKHAAAAAPEGHLGKRMTATHVDPEGRYIDYVLNSDSDKASSELAGRLQAPSLCTIMEALTPRMATDSINSEQLELLGDSLLKSYAGLEAFLRDDNASPGDLTNQRRALTNNTYMSTTCIEVGFACFLRPMSLSGGDLYLQHRPPGMQKQTTENVNSVWSASFVVDGGSATATPAAASSNIDAPEKSKNPARRKKKKKKTGPATDSSSLIDALSTSSVSKAEVNTPMGIVLGPGSAQHLRVSLQKKYLADLIEAMCGAFYLSGGWPLGIATLRVLLKIDHRNMTRSAIQEEKLASKLLEGAANPNAPDLEVNYTGGCKCGKVQYSSSGTPAKVWFVCHCSQCPVKDKTFEHPRLGKGAPWVPVPKLHFTDESNLSIERSSSYAKRARCADCSQAIYMQYDCEEFTDWVALDTLKNATEVLESKTMKRHHIYCDVNAMHSKEKNENIWEFSEPWQPDPCRPSDVVPLTYRDICRKCWQKISECHCKKQEVMKKPLQDDTDTARVSPGKTKLEIKTGKLFNTSTQSRIDVDFPTINHNDMGLISEKIGYQFQDKSILLEALTHCSIKTMKHNQRFEFLGDAIIDFSLISHLFTEISWAREADLSEARSSCLSNVYLAKVAIHKLHLHDFIKHNSEHLTKEFATYEPNVQVLEDYWNLNILQTSVDLTVDEASIRLDDAIALKNLSPLQVMIKSIKNMIFGCASGTNNIDNNFERGPEKCTIGAKACADALEALFCAIYLDCQGRMDIVMRAMVTCGVLHKDMITQIETGQFRKRNLMIQNAIKAEIILEDKRKSITSS